MINLLPPEEKQRIINGRKKKIIQIFCFLVFFFFVCIILVLFSLVAYLKDQLNYQKLILNEKKQTLENLEIKDLEEKIENSNSAIKKLSNFYRKEYYLTGILSRITDTFPSGVYITDLNISDTGDSFKLDVSGFAPTREILFDLRKKIEEAGFKDISFPPNNWVKSANIDFYIGFAVAKNK